MEMLPYRDPELLLALLSLGSRFANTRLDAEIRFEQAQGYAEKARLMAMHRVVKGEVELSTLQTLCLLSLVDFTSAFTLMKALL